MADDKFRLPGSSYDQLVRIIRGYGVMRGPAGPAEVARAGAINSTDVSRNNAFLISVGLVEGGNKKAMTELGKELGAALDHNVADEVSRLWRSVIEETEFLRQLVSSIRIRNGMEESALLAHIAYSARQPSSGTSKTGAASVLEILRTAGVVSEKDSKFVAADLDLSSEEPSSSVSAEEVGDWAGELGSRTSVETVLSRSPDERLGAFIIRVNVDVACSADELPSVTERLIEMRGRWREAEVAEDSVTSDS